MTLESSAPKALQTPLLAEPAAAMAAKLDRAQGLLRTYWQDFQTRCREDQDFREENLFLLAFATGEGLAEAKDLLRQYWRGMVRSDTHGDYQYHTWCRCGSITRRAFFFDWLGQREAWSADDLEEAAGAFLGFAFKHAYPVLAGRTRSSNNQPFSMALNLAVSGFLFGHKLADHPTGKFLFDYGLGRLPDLIGLFPGDGYGGEGSTYTSHVNTPLACWACELLGQLTGQDHFKTAFAPNGTSLRHFVEMELRLMGPDGLLAPWDHYGWQPEANASAYAYLAKAAADPRYLALIPALGLWDDPGHLAWGRDDPLWTLVWWPDQYRDYDNAELPAELFGWFLPKTGAALDDCQRRSRLMQVWDRCADNISGVCRGQTNPNHLVFSYAGEPVFQDGVPVEGKTPWAYATDDVLGGMSDEERDRFVRYLGSIGGPSPDLRAVVNRIAPGLIGGANAIVVDDEPWYWPGGSRVGKGEFHAAAADLQAVTADAAAYYQPRYDLKLARRSSLWTAAGFGLVVDALEAETEHSWTWQAHLRPDVALLARSARVRLPNGRHVLLAWADDLEASLTMLEDFPRTQEERCCRLELRCVGKTARFAVLIAPDVAAANLHWKGADAVEVELDGERHALVAGNLGGEARGLGPDSSTAPFAWRQPSGAIAELRQSSPVEHRADVHDLPDIEVERDLQLPGLAALLEWQSARRAPGPTRLSQLDACLAELSVDQPDVPALLAALESPHWPVQTAAADVLGRRGCGEAADALRRLLALEHARPEAELYPSAQDDEAASATTEDLGKRWRSKAALIAALGRLRDRQAVPLLGQVLSDKRDFYLVYSMAAQALGRVGGDRALAALEQAFLETEVNTVARARFARAAIGGVQE